MEEIKRFSEDFDELSRPVQALDRIMVENHETGVEVFVKVQDIDPLNAAAVAYAAAEAAPHTYSLLSITTEPLYTTIGEKYYNAANKLLHTVYDSGQGDLQWDAGVTPRLVDRFIFNSKEYQFTSENLIQTDNGITSITRTNGNGAAGTTDTYTITFTNGTTTTYNVVNGANGTTAVVENVRSQALDKVASSKLVDDELKTIEEKTDNIEVNESVFKIKDEAGNIVFAIDGSGLKALKYNLCDESGTIVATISKSFLDTVILKTSFIDNLSSDSIETAVTAKQAKYLKSLIDLHNQYFASTESGKLTIKDESGNISLVIDSAGLKALKYNLCDVNGTVVGEITSALFTSINSLLSETDYTPIPIPYVFGAVNSALYSREYVVRLFPESFLDFTPGVPITTNYRRDVAFSRQRKTTTAYEKIVKNVVLRGKNYKEKSVNVDFHVMNETVLENKNIRLCLFGVSFDNIDYLNDVGIIEGGGTKTMNSIEKLIFMGSVDTATTRNFTSIGTTSNPKDFTYNGQTKHIYGNHEARGGNCGLNYLRQPMHFSPTTIAYDPNVAGTTATGLIMWLMNGLRYRIPYNATYSTSGTDNGEYERTQAKTDALRCTPFGKYHHDYSQSLWDFCNQKGWITAVGETYSAWTGSVAQKAVTDLCMEYIASNPEYPFYSRDKARETSFTTGTAKSLTDNTQYSFDYNVYLTRYRTMDDLGVRLVNNAVNPSGLTAVGSDSVTYTIGTQITSQSLLTTINICTPTHIVWDMAANDWVFYVSNTGQSTGTDSLALSQLFVAAIRAQLGNNIYIGLKAKKDNGSFFPETWSDIALAQSYLAGGHLCEYNKLLITNFSDLTQKTNWIPIFPVSIPFASNFNQKFEDFVYGNVLVNSGEVYGSTSDVTHEGLNSSKAMAYQIYGWILYTNK